MRRYVILTAAFLIVVGLNIVGYHYVSKPKPTQNFQAHLDTKGENIELPSEPIDDLRAEPVQEDQAKEASSFESQVSTEGSDQITSGSISSPVEDEGILEEPVQEQAANATFDEGESAESSKRFVTVRVGGRELKLERGKKYLIISAKWNPNPRPYTPEEARRHIELCRKLRDPNLSGEELLKLREELGALGPGLALGAVWSTYLWFPLPGQEEPPDSEAIVIDLRDF